MLRGMKLSRRKIEVPGRSGSRSMFLWSRRCSERDTALSCSLQRSWRVLAVSAPFFRHATLRDSISIHPLKSLQPFSEEQFQLQKKIVAWNCWKEYSHRQRINSKVVLGKRCLCIFKEWNNNLKNERNNFWSGEDWLLHVDLLCLIFKPISFVKSLILGSKWMKDLSRSIQLLHLDQACVEYFTPNLTDGRACRLEMTKG